MRVKLIDYGVGNTMSIVRAFARMQIACDIARIPDELQGNAPLILGGVGRFDDAICKLNASGMKDAILEATLERGVPILGICLGMHLLTNGSEEGHCEGLGILDATVCRFNFSRFGTAERLPVPHIGWNTVEKAASASLPSILPASAAAYYFNHSYHLICNEECDVAVTQYGYPFYSAIQKDSIFGVQFHPEKSRSQGAELLLRFANQGQYAWIEE